MVLPLQSKEVEITINANNAEMLANYDDENGLFIFRGVPYAKPPVGELRWKSPQPVEEKSQIDARSFKPGCMQDTYITDWYHDVIESFEQDTSLFEHVKEVSEDCLYLNIWTPSVDKIKKKPVMVWVHGGADTGGWSYEPDYLDNQVRMTIRLYLLHHAPKPLQAFSLSCRLMVSKYSGTNSLH